MNKRLTDSQKKWNDVYEDNKKFIRFDTVDQLIYVSKRMSIHNLYSAGQDQFDEPDYMYHPSPMSAQTPDQYSFINGWNLADETSKKNLTDGGWQVVEPKSHKLKEMWMCLQMLGDISDDMQFKYSIDEGPWIYLQNRGEVNEPIKVDDCESLTVESYGRYKMIPFTIACGNIFAGIAHIPVAIDYSDQFAEFEKQSNSDLMLKIIRGVTVFPLPKTSIVK